MEFSITYIAIIVAALIIGAAVGYVFGQANTNRAQAPIVEAAPASDINQLKLSLAAQFDQNAATTAQLAKTVELLKQQVITNAREYSDIDVSGHFSEDNDSASAEPPRDWAPKPANAIGTLSEEYGLKEEGLASK